MARFQFTNVAAGGAAVTLWAMLSCPVFGAPADDNPPARSARLLDSALVKINGTAAPAPSLPVSGFRMVATESGPQLAVMEPATMVASMRQGEELAVRLPMRPADAPCTVTARVSLAAGTAADVGLSLEETIKSVRISPGKPLRLEASGGPRCDRISICMKAPAGSGDTVLVWSDIRLTVAGISQDVVLTLPQTDPGNGPPPVLPPLRPALETALLEWDWRMQDGIGTPREPSTWMAAVGRTLRQGDALLDDLRAAGVALEAETSRWQQLKDQWQLLSNNMTSAPARWESLWREVHMLRRAIVLKNPLARTGPLAFVKHVPSIFSHQLTQYEGKCARPGGGVFVLENPGESMQCRQLAAGALPLGNYEHLDVSHDGKRVLFAFCHAETTPRNREENLDRHYHLLEVRADGSGLRQLTDGPYDDFSPRYLPDGDILFLSTRRGGYHRCGRGPCNIFTLARCKADGTEPRTISFHETHEWDPVVLNDGRVLYTRWDYVDRDAVHYQQLWSARPDGSDVRAYYGNATFSPVGVWEARPIPGSHQVMATAAAHHAMTAGSIIRLDITRGYDGPGPITRLTPDVLFPESEAPVLPNWHVPLGVTNQPPMPTEQLRWPGHCYKSPFPLAENYFLVSYSFDSLVGEPGRNVPNMFGLYLADAFGNKELLYRDPNHCSLWAMPLRPRPEPPQVSSHLEPSAQADGIFMLRDVYQGWPSLRPGTIRKLRVVQVLPKSTPHLNTPPVGLPNGSPGRQVLGTVPVEPDGSACFRAPAGIALAFQALDDHGQAVQMMRSLTYLQPGETVSCIGCHEPRDAAPPPGPVPMSLARPPSAIQPGPDGSKPFSYPILVQPVLDRKCVSCHNAAKPDGNVILTGEPQGRYTTSYLALAPRVPFSAWGNAGGVEPVTLPGRFGARGSKLMQLLLAGHEDVDLTDEEIERLATWMDTNVLFYGTFDAADQARQQRGERIAGPALE